MAARSNWSLTGFIALALFAMCAVILQDDGWNAAAVHTVTRVTARTSLILFLLAFSASALRRLWQTAATAWLLRNRRYLGVSFAISHYIHLAAIATLVYEFPDGRPMSLTLILGGGLAYAFILAMAVTSFDRTAKWLGPRKWRILHTAGSYWVWTIFAFSYLGRAVKSPSYIPAAIAVSLAMGLRIVAYLRKR